MIYRHLIEERKGLRASLKPLLDKLGRGERLSFAERSTWESANKRIGEIESELAGREESRRQGDAWEASRGSTPSYVNEAEDRAFTRWMRDGVTSPELRAAGEATGAAGGYLVPPGWWQRLQVAMKAYGGTSNDFQPLETDTGQPLQWATVDPTAVLGQLVAENSQVSAQDYTFGQGTLGAYMYSSGVNLVSLQLAQDSAFDIDSFVMARAGEALGRAIAAAAISGTGASQPLGIIPALNAKGSAGTVGSAVTPTGGTLTLGTAQQVNVLSHTPATAGFAPVTELAGNLLAPSTILAMIEAVDPAYRAMGAKFYVNSNQLSGLRSIVDNYGRPFFTSLQGPDSPTLYGYPVALDQNIPNLTASTAGGPIFGHLQSAMVLRTVKGAGLLRLTERYADFLQVGYIGYKRLDIRSNDLRAAVVVKPAAT